MNTDILEKAAHATRSALPGARPICSIILGSGWGGITDSLKTVRTLNYHDIPGLGATGVEGHAGRLVLAECAGMQIIVFQGRRHWYEGAGWEPVAIPVYLSLKLGVSVLLLTNAAGGINKNLSPGNLMVIEDHINAMGSNPLIGNTDSAWGPKFADQTSVYDPLLRKMLAQAGSKTGTSLSHGIYAATSGPVYETPAETMALRSMGADAVGMSTVPEAILANAAGIKVAGISCITNSAAQAGQAKLAHKEVIDTASKALPAIRALVMEFLKELAAKVSHAETEI